MHSLQYVYCVRICTIYLFILNYILDIFIYFKLIYLKNVYAVCIVEKTRNIK